MLVQCETIQFNPIQTGLFQILEIPGKMERYNSYGFESLHAHRTFYVHRKFIKNN